MDGPGEDLYFGSQGAYGHFLWRPDLFLCVSMHAWEAWNESGLFPFGLEVDGGLQPKTTRKQGRYNFHVRGDWCAIAFWDYSGDSRPGSCSVFFAKGVDQALARGAEDLHASIAMARAKHKFPSIFNRFKFELVPFQGVGGQNE